MILISAFMSYGFCLMDAWFCPSCIGICICMDVVRHTAPRVRRNSTWKLQRDSGRFLLFTAQRFIVTSTNPLACRNPSALILSGFAGRMITHTRPNWQALSWQSAFLFLFHPKCGWMNFITHAPTPSCSSRRQEAHSVPTRPPARDQSLVTSAATKDWLGFKAPMRVRRALVREPEARMDRLRLRFGRLDLELRRVRRCQPDPVAGRKA